jgi:hypothetical protein
MDVHRLAKGPGAETCLKSLAGNRSTAFGDVRSVSKPRIDMVDVAGAG